MSIVGIFLSAAGAVILLLAAFEGIARASGARFLSTVILGADNRTSTSKTFIFMWTLLVAWALASLLIAGELVPHHACVPPTDVSNAAHRCKQLGDEVGLLQVGWVHFLHAGLAGSYLVLLGIPAAAGVAAAGITTSKVNGPGYKAPKPKGSQGGVFVRIREIFSADDGTTDIGDFQYVIFNLITAVYFVTQFVNPDGSGLPTIPNTLLGLTSVSAGLYVGKKAVGQAQPTVTGVFPQPIHDSDRFTVIGTGLAVDPASPTQVQPRITIDGMAATNVVMENGNLVATAPPSVSAGGNPIARHLEVLNPYGGITSDFQVQCQ